MKISSRAKALLSFLSQFSEPFDLKEALNCPPDIEMGHPNTWNSSVDKWGIFRELFHADFLVLTTNDDLLRVSTLQPGFRTASNQRYLYTVTEKGRQFLLPQPSISKTLRQFFFSTTTVSNRKEPVFTQAISN